MVIGAICAVYLAPLADPGIDAFLTNIVVDPEARARLGSFVIGIGGIGVVGIVMDFWKLRRGTKPPPPGKE